MVPFLCRSKEGTPRGPFVGRTGIVLFSFFVEDLLQKCCKNVQGIAGWMARQVKLSANKSDGLHSVPQDPVGRKRETHLHMISKGLKTCKNLHIHCNLWLSIKINYTWNLLGVLIFPCCGSLLPFLRLACCMLYQDLPLNPSTQSTTHHHWRLAHRVPRCYIFISHLAQPELVKLFLVKSDKQRKYLWIHYTINMQGRFLPFHLWYSNLVKYSLDTCQVAMHIFIQSPCWGICSWGNASK